MGEFKLLTYGSLTLLDAFRCRFLLHHALSLLLLSRAEVEGVEHALNVAEEFAYL